MIDPNIPTNIIVRLCLFSVKMPNVYTKTVYTTEQTQYLQSHIAIKNKLNINNNEICNCFSSSYSPIVFLISEIILNKISRIQNRTIKCKLLRDITMLLYRFSNNFRYQLMTILIQMSRTNCSIRKSMC